MWRVSKDSRIRKKKPGKGILGSRPWIFAMFLSPAGNCCVRDLGQAGSRGKGQLKGGLRNQGGIFNGSMSRNLGRLRPSPPDTFPSS